jgi:transcriptional regulator with XRE-family HTH domain
MNIQSAIDRHGTTKAELARKMEVAPSYITQLVSGQSSPSMKMLDKLADLIGCKRWEFFIDEMDRSEVARILGLTAQTAPQPAAESASAEQPSAEQQEELPFGQQQPSAIGQQAIVCPHCHQALVFNIASYEQK